MKWNKYITPRMTKAEKRRVYTKPKKESKVLLKIQHLYDRFRAKIEW